jgi:phosphatidylglycerophosphate synthase
MATSTLNRSAPFRRPATQPTFVDLWGHPVRQRDIVAVALTAARLAVVPAVLVGLGQKSALAAVAIFTFVALDIIDGVIARAWTTDGAARRAADSAVDRIAIDASLVVAGAVGLIPWMIIAAFLARDCYCTLVCLRMYRASGGSVIKADWTHRSLNLSMAFGGVVAPWMPTEIRTPAALLVLAYAVVVAIDLTRMSAYVRAEFGHGAAGRRVVSAHKARNFPLR